MRQKGGATQPSHQPRAHAGTAAKRHSPARPSPRPAIPHRHRAAKEGVWGWGVAEASAKETGERGTEEGEAESEHARAMRHAPRAEAQAPSPQHP